MAYSLLSGAEYCAISKVALAAQGRSRRTRHALHAPSSPMSWRGIAALSLLLIMSVLYILCPMRCAVIYVTLYGVSPPLSSLPCLSSTCPPQAALQYATIVPPPPLDPTPPPLVVLRPQLADPAQLMQPMCKHQTCWWLQAEGAGRDVLLLDIALDNYFRLCIERTDKSSLSGDDLLDMVALVLSNACIAGESQDFGQVCLPYSASYRFPPVCLFLQQYGQHEDGYCQASHLPFPWFFRHAT